jgi:hypothetical protein
VETNYYVSGVGEAKLIKLIYISYRFLNLFIQVISPIYSGKIRYTANSKERLEEAHKLMGITNNLSIQLEGVFNQWAKIRITDPEVKKLIQIAFVPNKEVLENIQAGKDDELSTCFKNMTDAAFEYAMTNETQQLETTKGGLFGAYNAVIGYLQNVRSYKRQRSKIEIFIV